MLMLDLSPAMEQHIVSNAQTQNLSVTEYILQHLPIENPAWHYGKDVFGCYAESEDGTLSQNVKSLVEQQVRAKYGKNSD